MKRHQFLKDLALFVVLSTVFSLLYYFFNKTEIDTGKDYEFIIYSVLAASAVVFVPLIQGVFNKKK